MGIANVPQKKPDVPLPKPPEVKSNTLRDEVVNAGYISLKSLVPYAQGKAWMTTFFNQKLGPGSEPMAPQFDDAKSLQSYLRIRKFTFKVQAELSRNPNDEGEMELTGEAIILPGVVPNIYDAFTADIGDGRVGFFIVNRVEQLSVYNDAAYQIGYGLYDYYTPEIQEQMDSRVVQDSVYDMDYVNTGKNPIIAYDEYFTRERLEREERSLCDHFFSQYFDKEMGTLSVPDADAFLRLYDPYHTRFVDRLIEHEKRPSRMRMIVLDESMNSVNTPVTLWDMLVKQDVRQFAYVQRDMQMVGTSYFRGGSALMGGVAYSGFNDVVFPVCDGAPLSQRDILGDESSNGDPLGLMFKRLGYQGNYVLSAAFYEQRRVDMTVLEREVHNLITGQPISVDNVDKLLNLYYTAPRLVQFYAFPLLVTLCRTASQRLV